MLHQRLYISIILCLLCFSAAKAQPGPVPDADSAIAMALAYTGFADTRGFSSDKVLAAQRSQVMQDTLSPHLHRLINGRAAWLVEFQDIKMKRNSSDTNLFGPDDWNSQVYIDANTGQLLKIVCWNPQTSGPDDNRWRNIRLCMPLTYDPEPRLSAAPTPGTFRDALIFEHNHWVPAPQRIEGYLLDFAPLGDDSRRSPEATETTSLWYILMKDVNVHAFRPEFGIVPLVAFRCFDPFARTLGRCGGVASGKPVEEDE
ncbi:MAG: hypothetical protein AB1483_11625 [Candidatus Zixiibacteriota bacterium]